MLKTPIQHLEAASTIAVIRSSNEPLLFLSDQQDVIAAGASFCRAFGIDPRTICGKNLSELGGGEWAMPELASLLSATASGTDRSGATPTLLLSHVKRKLPFH